MSEEGLRLKKKKFSSLSRNKTRHRVGSSPIPINNLTRIDDRSRQNPEVRNLFTNSYSPTEAIKRSERLRNQLEQEVPASPTKRGNSYNFIDTTKIEYVEDVSGSKVLTHSILKANPKLEMNIVSVDRNGNVFKTDGNKSIKMYIPIAGNYIVFSKGQSIIDRLVVHETQIESIKFADHRILVELKNLIGYIYVIYMYDDSGLWNFFHTTRWMVENERFSNESLIQERNWILTRRYSNIESSKVEKRNEQKTEFNESLSKINPSDMYDRRILRSKANYLIEYDESLHDNENHEKPASFSPPLNHTFQDKKIFTINYSDFKTLYNNEWINDSIIDFFIKYEVENAIQKSILEQESIYAFNSFFFNKIMEKKANQDEPDYYQNVKRWLNKVDLMSYSHVIIPINEYAHWYCCIIRGLPELLRKANDDKANIINVTNSQSSIETTGVCEDVISSYLGEYLKHESGDMKIGDAEIRESKSKKKEKSTRAEIFVFDSLSQKHSNIHLPLKRVLIGYCKDKFDVEIQKDQIRVQNAKVPKQNNFNDCGIHVIYNVRKWISNITECERLWRSTQSRYAARAFFLAEERNKMRKELIKLLLSLHEKQMEKSCSSTPRQNPEESDDEIEVIEYVPKEKTDIAESIQNEIEFNFEKDPDNASSVTTPPPRTLDPKVQNLIDEKKKPNHVLINDTLNDMLLHKTVNKSVLQSLNITFTTKNYKLEDEEKNMVYELVEYTNLLDAETEQNEVDDQINRFQEKHKKVTRESEVSRPKNQSFRINHHVGITKTVDMSESDIMYDDLTNLHLSDNSASNENLDSREKSKADIEDGHAKKEENSNSDSGNSFNLLDKLNKNPFKKRKVV